MATRTTKKDLEAKISLLEKKLQKLTESVASQTAPQKPKNADNAPKPKGTLPKGTGDAPKPAEPTKPKGTLPKGTGDAPKPAPKSAKATAPANMAQVLENAYQNWPMTSTADYKAKTPGYTPASNRYFARLHGVVGKTATKDWNLQKKAITGYTAPSDQYFATKQRLAYHPAVKTFTGYGIKAEGSVQVQQAPPPPPKVESKPAQTKTQGTLPKGFNASSEKIESKPPEPKPAQTKTQGTLPKGFKPATAAATAKPKGTLPKGF